VAKKTAISIDDSLLHAADDTARRLGVSRSRLFALAVGDYLERQRRDQMLQRLNYVYADVEPLEKRLLKGMKAKARRTAKERW
jgi:metal-responsive CopG/Arc/MetJ family transcriptional regulator